MRHSPRNTWILWVLIIGLSASVIVPIVLFLFGQQVLWEPIFALVAVLVGSLITFVTYIQKQYLDEVTFFRQLFREFNERYDTMNSSLNNIVIQDGAKGLSAEEILCLFDYFNLCGEEYLFYKQGYIPEDVWKAWRKGMSYYLQDERICDLWKKEEATDSYYGLSLNIVNGEKSR